MIKIKNECVGCDYCIGCGARHTEHYYCNNCDSEETLYYFGNAELCLDCIEELVSKEKEEDSICDQCGEECTVYGNYGLCEDCFFESLEIVEGSEN